MIELKREDFITQYPPYNLMRPDHVSQIWTPKELNLYVHIPFCARICDFCYYKVMVPKGREMTQVYVDALIREIRMLAARPEVQDRIVHTMYFGGGTPTILSSEQLRALVNTVRECFRFHPDLEFCVEARPGAETSVEKLHTLRALGVHRLSMGVQSLDEQVLVMNGRNHGLRDFYETYEQARQAGFDWINIDIMSGLVGETPETWRSTIQEVLRLRPENVALYKFEVYYNTRLFRTLRGKPELLMTNKEEAEMIRQAYAWLEEGGYQQLDAFSWATDMQYDHRHRRRSLLGGEMLAAGLSSHSWFDHYIFQNTSDLQQYYEMIEGGQLPITRAYPVSVREDMARTMVFGMKNLMVDRALFAAKFGVDPLNVFGNEIAALVEGGYLGVTDELIRITPEYSLYGDDLARAFFLPEHSDIMLAHLQRA